MMHRVIIGIGSNINAKQNINMAMELLSNVASIVSLSDIITTKPIGITDQADFSNAAVAVQTNLSQEELRHQLKVIEDKIGRDRSRPKFGPREIDLDIVVFDNLIIDDDYHSRSFLKKLVDSVWNK